MKEKYSIKGIVCHLYKNNILWASSNNVIYKSEDYGKTWEKVKKIRSSIQYFFFDYSHLFNRLLRLGIRTLYILKSNTVLVISEGIIYRYASKTRKLKKVNVLRNGRGPLRNGITEDREGNVYYGEYWSNKERNCVNLYKSTDDGQTWNIIHSFREIPIRHIHAVQYDSFLNLLWLCTGDKDEECMIAYSKDFGKTFTEIGIGSQKWRAMSLTFTKNYLYWGTDNPSGHNNIFQWRRSDRFLKEIATVKGPVYDSIKIGNKILFSTAVEKGEGNQDGYARIYCVNKNLDNIELFKSKKDSWHPVLFGYGRLELVLGDIEAGSFWVVTRGLVGGERSILFQLDCNENNG